MKEQKCKNCGVVKPMSGFYPSKSYKSGYVSTCKQCMTIKRRGSLTVQDERFTAIKDADYDEIQKLKKNLTLPSSPNSTHYRLLSAIERGGWSYNCKLFRNVKCTPKQLLEHLNDNPYGFQVGDAKLDIWFKEKYKDYTYTNLVLLPIIYTRAVLKDKPYVKRYFDVWFEQDRYWFNYWLKKYSDEEN